MTRMRVVVACAALSENDIVARESAASRRQGQRPRLDGRGTGQAIERSAAVAGNTATGSADAAARPQNRTVGPGERLGGDPRQRRWFSRELSSHRRRMTRAPSRADGWLRPGAFMPIARMCPSRTLRPRGAILLAKPAEPPAAPEAPGRRLRLPKRDPSGSGPWRLVISAV